MLVYGGVRDVWWKRRISSEIVPVSENTRWYEGITKVREIMIGEDVSKRKLGNVSASKYVHTSLPVSSFTE